MGNQKRKGITGDQQGSPPINHTNSTWTRLAESPDSREVQRTLQGPQGFDWLNMVPDDESIA